MSFNFYRENSLLVVLNLLVIFTVVVLAQQTDQQKNSELDDILQIFVTVEFQQPVQDTKIKSQDKFQKSFQNDDDLTEFFGNNVKENFGRSSVTFSSPTKIDYQKLQQKIDSCKVINLDYLNNQGDFQVPNSELQNGAKISKNSELKMDNFQDKNNEYSFYKQRLQSDYYFQNELNDNNFDAQFSPNLEMENLAENFDEQKIIEKNDFNFKMDDFIIQLGNKLFRKGTPFYFVGMNHDFLLQHGVDDRSRVDKTMDLARKAGITVIRTPAFANPPDFKPVPYRTGQKHILQTFPGQYNETVFKGLDYVLDSARRHGIRLLLSFGNYEPKFGGADVYSSWRYSFQYNSINKNIIDFYKDEQTRLMYMANMCAIASRINSISGIPYNLDPTVLGWEIMNNAQCPDCPGATFGDVLYDWYREMVAYVREIVPHQLIGSGQQGAFGESDPQLMKFNKGPWIWCRGVDSLRINALPEIDFATFYADWTDVDWNYQLNDVCNLNCKKQWIHDNILQQIRYNKKPVIMTHFGVPDKEQNLHLYEKVVVLGRQLIEQNESLAGLVFTSAGMEGDVDWEGMTIYLDGSAANTDKGRPPTPVEIQQMQLVEQFYSKYYRLEEENTCAKKINAKYDGFSIQPNLNTVLLQHIRKSAQQTNFFTQGYQ
eukprot:TRINITY_DN3544_c0_g2_i1.p1 TRINITY_DN3544_c0_g2~~TRINITY_DN3544_c0_g2_i1.p1  ORF type:complete len:683 (+),score=81.78 TRINITY_DN3544_c0_g2_i1:84-2051(+)